MPASVVTTPAVLHALLEGIVDYAGLFPPAALSLSDALANYARYRQGPDRWMLGRFVVPVARLEGLDAHRDLWTDVPEDDPFALSLLTRGGDTTEAFLTTLREDLHASNDLHRRHDGRLRVEALEVRWPAEALCGNADTHTAFLDELAETLRTASLEALELFLEVPVAEETPDLLPPLLDALAHADALHAALKIRLGGAAPADHPEPALFAPILDACRRAGVRFKATAGLHHPVRHYNEELNGTMNGFLNVFGGAALARIHDLDLTTFTQILEEENPAAFRLDHDRFAWRHLAANANALADARRRFATSFGSCSFDEPREDLAAMGWL